jgi:DNA sulfur modification protein DndD
LDSRIKEYFLFDGEKIERLTRASHDQRKEVAKGIRNLLNIDSLENALKAMRKLARKLDTELAGKSTGEMPKLILALEQNTNRKTALKEESENLETELRLAESEKRQVDKELEKYREIKHLLAQRKELEKQTADAETELHELMNAMKTRAGKSSLLLCLPVVKTVYADLAKKKEHGEIPPQIRKEFIEKLLDEGRCICGNPLPPGSESFKCVLEWQTRVSQSDLQDSALELWRYLSAVMARSDELADGMEVDLQRYAVRKNALDIFRSRLTDIGAKIGTSERKDAANLEGHRANLEKKRVEKTAQLRIREAELQQLEEEYNKLVEQRRELQRQKGLMTELEKRSQLALDASEALKAVGDSFAAEVRERIGNSATELLATLLDKESRGNLNGVVVTDDYSLQILDRWKKRFLANISAGQRQILSISFIVALAKTAAGGIALEMPFFMDTPFGRLSFEHRANLIKHIPTVCSQWILLATDTEFTRREASLLSSSGTWGRFYTLKPTEDGNTQIREMDTANAAAMLRSDEENIE